MTTYTIHTQAIRNLFGKRAGNKGYEAILKDADSYMGVTSAEGPTAADAKQALLTQLAELAENRFKRAYVFCGDGTVLAVYHTIGGFAYDITDAKRAQSSGCLTSSSFDAVVEQAKRHAEQSYGGVVNVCK